MKQPAWQAFEREGKGRNAKRDGRARREGGRETPRVFLAPKTPFPKTPFPFPFKLLPRRLCMKRIPAESSPVFAFQGRQVFTENMGRNISL